MLHYEKEYHDIFHPDLIKDNGYYFLRSKLAFIRYFNELDKDKRILEYGVGLGQNIYLFKDRFGYDVSKFALDFIEKKGYRVFSTIEEIPENYFDIILCCHVLEHLENPFDTIVTLKSKLKTTGKLILVLPKEFHGKAAIEMSPEQHLYCWNFRNINNLLIHSGLKVISNKQFAGTGYHILSFLAKINFRVWKLSTLLLGTVLNRKELVITAIKGK